MRRFVMSLLLAAGLVSAGVGAPARAEIGEITIAQQYGGTLKNKPESWKDLFFPETHVLAGD